MDDKQYELASALYKILDVISDIDNRLFKIEDKNGVFNISKSQSNIEKIKNDVFEIIKIVG